MTGRSARKKKYCENTQGPAGMEGFLRGSDEKTNMSLILMAVFQPLSSLHLFFQSCWVPPRGSTSTTKIQTGKTSVCVDVLVCVSRRDKLSQKNAAQESQVL